MDTSVFTHFSRAGLHDVIGALAPQGIVLVPSEVNDEIARGRELYADIPPVNATRWAHLTSLDELELVTLLQVKSAIGGTDRQHLGECAVIACAHHRSLTAILDDKAAVAQASLRSVPTHSSLWIVIEAYKTLLDQDRAKAADIVDALLETGMHLPFDSGTSLMVWAYEHGLLP